MNKQEAELKQRELLEEQVTNVFCPLARKLCDPKCVCLINQIEKYNHSDTYTAIVRCNNAMFQYSD